MNPWLTSGPRLGDHALHFIAVNPKIGAVSAHAPPGGSGNICRVLPLVSALVFLAFGVQVPGIPEL